MRFLIILGFIFSSLFVQAGQKYDEAEFEEVNAIVRYGRTSLHDLLKEVAGHLVEEVVEAEFEEVNARDRYGRTSLHNLKELAAHLVDVAFEEVNAIEDRYGRTSLHGLEEVTVRLVEAESGEVAVAYRRTTTTLCSRHFNINR